LLKRGTGETILYAQLVNIVIAAVFFFLVPYVGIQPKTNLAIYLLLSSALVILWRIYIVPKIRSERRQEAILVGSGATFDELYREVSMNDRYPFIFIEHLRLARAHKDAVRNSILTQIHERGVTLIVVDISGRSVEELFPEWYDLMQNGIRFVDASELYEQLFDRVPLPLLEYSWFMHHAFTPQAVAYGVAKRVVDIGIAVVLGVVSLAVFPFVALAIRLDDRGPIFFTHARVGMNNKIIHIYKFRSMSIHVKEHITKVGAVLRKYRIDELPQLWNVIRGDLSMIGPRPESPHLVEGYAKEIPYYATRHIVQPGLSGWAQINEYDAPKRDVLDVERTKKKLACDLYYVKNRSFLLDITIALKTIRAIVSRSGT
ncbi:MAG: sugar transferase, partial [Chitinophagaceae bacterium]